MIIRGWQSGSPSWIVKDLSGRPVEGRKVFPFRLGLPFERFLLDISREMPWKYMTDSIDIFIEDWGFDLLKLDFLFAPYFNPRFGDKQEAGESIRRLLTYVKKKYPAVYTIASGCPFSDALGRVDAVRISDDIIIPWFDRWPIARSVVHKMKLKHLERNLEARSMARGLWHLDPDVFVCRKSLGFSDVETIKLQQLIRSTGGLVFLGDDLPSLPQDRVDKYILPLFKETP